jgi:hypothetical protein
MFVKSNRGWLVLAYIPLRGEHASEYLNLKNTRDNRREANRICKDLEKALRAGDLEKEFARRFPDSKHLARLGLKSGAEPTLGEFAVSWLDERRSTLTAASHNQYGLLLKNHLPAARGGAARACERPDGLRCVRAMAEASAERGDGSARPRGFRHPSITHFWR